MKQVYRVPSIKVVSFKVEEGFTASRLNLNVGIKATSSDESDTEGTEGFFAREL